MSRFSYTYYNVNKNILLSSEVEYVGYNFSIKKYVIFSHRDG